MIDSWGTVHGVKRHMNQFKHNALLAIAEKVNPLGRTRTLDPLGLQFSAVTNEPAGGYHMLYYYLNYNIKK